MSKKAFLYYCREDRLGFALYDYQKEDFILSYEVTKDLWEGSEDMRIPSSVEIALDSSLNEEEVDRVVSYGAVESYKSLLNWGFFEKSIEWSVKKKLGNCIQEDMESLFPEKLSGRDRTILGKETERFRNLKRVWLRSFLLCDKAQEICVEQVLREKGEKGETNDGKN